jgi:hypothetical protein
MRLNRPSPLLVLRWRSTRLAKVAATPQKARREDRGRSDRARLWTPSSWRRLAFSFARAKHVREERKIRRELPGRGPSRRRRARARFRSSARKRSAVPPRFLADQGSSHHGSDPEPCSPRALSRPTRWSPLAFGSYQSAGPVPLDACHTARTETSSSSISK